MVAVAALAGMAAWCQQQRSRPAPTSTPGTPPASLDRSEFLAPTAPLLIAVFTSETCSSCDAVWAELSGYESATVAAKRRGYRRSCAAQPVQDRLGTDRSHRRRCRRHPGSLRWPIGARPADCVARPDRPSELAVTAPNGPTRSRVLKPVTVASRCC